MNYVLVAEEFVPEDFDIDKVFDGDAHSLCEEINDWGDCARRYFSIEPEEDHNP